MVATLLGGGSPDYLLSAKRHYPVGDGISYQSVWRTEAGLLAAGRGVRPKVYNTELQLKVY